MTAQPPERPADRPVGPPVDATPRPLPARIPHQGQAVLLEPLHVDHVPQLWQAAAAGTPDGDLSWDYMGYGPFASEAALRSFVGGFATTHDPMVWAVRPMASGTADGWLSLMDIQPGNAAIEIGNIWFGPKMQRSRAATEAMFLLMDHAMTVLGYRRLLWKCNALNAPSRRAAARLGFTYEGELRAHMVIKGRRRDSSYFSILHDEWPARRQALLAWLDAANFDSDGRALRRLGG